MYHRLHHERDLPGTPLPLRLSLARRMSAKTRRATSSAEVPLGQIKFDGCPECTEKVTTTRRSVTARAPPHRSGAQAPCPQTASSTGDLNVGSPEASSTKTGGPRLRRRLSAERSEQWTGGTMRLQWTDHDGRVHSGQPERPDDANSPYQAGRAPHTSRSSRMFIPKDYLTKESTMFTPSTPTATMSCTGCDNITHLRIRRRARHSTTAESAGAVAGYPFGTAPQSAAQPTPPAPAPRRAESLAHLVEETEVERAAFGA